MGLNKTQIEWVKNPDGTQGFTWNPITGCLNGCEYCYARRLANTRLRERYLANTNYLRQDIDDSDNPYGAVLSPDQDPFYPRFWEDRLYEIKRPLASIHWRLQEPKGIFVCDMSDLFGIGIPEEWTRQVLYAIEERPEHRFYLLTKQPQNLITFQFPDNCWVGVTVTNEGITYPDMMEEACRNLAQIKASVKYLSFEPLQSSIYKLDLLTVWGINWVIIGGQSRPTVMPKIGWVEEIELAARKASIPTFEKDNLKALLQRELIQEMPSED
ncbi:hypothetical protein LCGC14_0396380 [marine sediment metagenome]|uniref:Phage protein Gp37/Gp68 n=1 Tax=marine sediment metagenome TaxID=412755 RepID=A0A0F9VK19_9ZZZZ